jgi:DNA-binding phage protein
VNRIGRTTKWDVAAHLKTATDIAAYRKAVRAEGDLSLLAVVEQDILRARRKQRRSRKT